MRRDAVLDVTLRAAGVVSASLVVLVAAFVLFGSVPAITALGPRLLGDSSWHPSSDAWGLGPMIAGSLLVTGGAVAIAGPVGVLAAVALRFHLPRRPAGAVRAVVQLMAGVPSVVLGFWGLVVLAPRLGQGLLAGVLVLALLIVPTVVLLGDAALGAVPAGDLRAGFALGLTAPAVAWRVAVPAAREALATAVLLAAARAIGETMVVVMLTGNVVQWPDAVTAPVRTLTANIALEMAYAEGVHRSALFASGLLLLIVVVSIVAAHAALGRRRHA